MAQLNNTHVYGTLEVNKAITANGGINVASLKNNTDSEDNSAKITLNSVIVNDKASSENNENKLSSIMLTSVNNIYGKKETGGMSSYPAQTNSLYSYAAELKNNARNLLSLDLREVNSQEHKTFDSTGKVKTYDIDKHDRTFSIDLSVSGNYTEADAETPNFSSDKITSTYTSSKTEKPADATAGTFRGYTNTTKSIVKVPLNVPYEGGEIVTDETYDRVKINSIPGCTIDISDNHKIIKLLDGSSKFKAYIQNNGLAIKRCYAISRSA